MSASSTSTTASYYRAETSRVFSKLLPKPQLLNTQPTAAAVKHITTKPEPGAELAAAQALSSLRFSGNAPHGMWWSALMSSSLILQYIL